MWFSARFRIFVAIHLVFSQVSLQSESNKFLRELISGPLHQQHLFLVFDPDVYYEVEFDSLIREFWEGSSFHVLFTSIYELPSMLEKLEPAFQRGNNFVAFFIFKTFPDSILEYLDKSINWNPSYCLFVSLSSSLDNPKILESKAVQRSRYLSFIQINKNRNNETGISLYYGLNFRFYNGSEIRKDLKGPWDAKAFTTKNDIFKDRYLSFDGANLQLASWCDDFPFLYTLKDGNCTGSGKDLIKILASKWNFTFDVQLVPQDYSWGSFENGSWTGMLADLAYNGKDLLINSLFLTEERNAWFDTTYPYHTEGFAFLIAKPPSIPRWIGFIYPFSQDTWIVLALIVLSVFFCYYVAALIFKEWNKTTDISFYFLFIFGALLRQQSSPPANLNGAKSWAAIWWLSCVVLCTAYTGNLVAFLTVPVFPSRIETVDQLASSSLRLCMQDYGSLLPNALKNSEDPSIYRLGQALDLFPYNDQSANSYEIGFQWVMKMTHALVESFSYMSALTSSSNYSQDTYIIKEQLYPSYVAWILPKNTPFTELFSKEIQRLVESGETRKLYELHLNTKYTNDLLTDKIVSSSPIEMDQLQGIFFILLSGLSLSTCVFFIELVVNALCNQKKRTAE